jgi:hypothetical protein
VRKSSAYAASGTLPHSRRRLAKNQDKLYRKSGILRAHVRTELAIVQLRAKAPIDTNIGIISREASTITASHSNCRCLIPVFLNAIASHIVKIGQNWRSLPQVQPRITVPARHAPLAPCTPMPWGHPPHFSLNMTYTIRRAAQSLLKHL